MPLFEKGEYDGDFHPTRLPAHTFASLSGCPANGCHASVSPGSIGQRNTVERPTSFEYKGYACRPRAPASVKVVPVVFPNGRARGEGCVSSASNSSPTTSSSVSRTVIQHLTEESHDGHGLEHGYKHGYGLDLDWNPVLLSPPSLAIDTATLRPRPVPTQPLTKANVAAVAAQGLSSWNRDRGYDGRRRMRPLLACSEDELSCVSSSNECALTQPSSPAEVGSSSYHGRALRRSPNVDNLRLGDAANTLSISTLSLNESINHGARVNYGVGSLHPLGAFDESSGGEPNLHNGVPVPVLSPPAVTVSTPEGSITVLFDADRERITRWRDAATTHDRGLTMSPLSVRRFTDEEMDHYCLSSRSSVRTAIRDAPTGLSPVIRGDWDGRGDDDVARASDGGFAALRTQPIADPDWGGPGFAGLFEWQRVHTQATHGILLPEASFSGVGFAESDRVRRVEAPHDSGSLQLANVQRPTPRTSSPGPARNSSVASLTSSRNAAHPPVVHTVGPPTSLGRPSHPSLHPILEAAAKDDPQTYTKEGLCAVLAKLYTPAEIPAEVLEQLPNAKGLSALSIARSSSQARTADARTFIPLRGKDVNYLTHYIDKLVADKERKIREITNLEAQIEDVEVSKAGMQGDINQYFAAVQAGETKIDGLLEVIRVLMNGDGGVEEKLQAVDMAKELGFNLRALGMRVEDRNKRRQALVKFWENKAHAAEEYAKAMEEAD
ncbi:uncharacterized protein BDR25DRAFT_342899 [Lindgomyces ingoldianus]|uniref:Uncharacterized protein n=1 Tax=Lindgomyces ingoldianus TaxID=673940 RepID=A0ACB6QUN8_9PLEO|nr:uncharacterized protein BDR25DRAFT_342899 [Lindgomyces ingoldianus]KAF2470582.1 hypothetical protein BDR25DRAFT_342899 [Lindgomyces ingoldianus]